MSLGLSDVLKDAFPETMPAVKEVNYIKDISQEWMAGFFFFFWIYES